MNTNKPIIGISGSVIVDQGGMFPGYRRSYVNEDYILSVIQNGGIPFILPFTEDESIIDSYIEEIDGLILSGGHDVFPLNYNAETTQKLGEVYPERDNFDFRLLEKSIEKNIPILGICRGFQIINVKFGGTLHQDITYSGIEKPLKHSQNHSPGLPTHFVDIQEDSILSELFGEKKVLVNSFHHQILNTVGNDLKIAAQSSDGVIEAIEHKNYKFLLGVQWHPEMLHKTYLEMNEIFKRLINLSKKEENK